MAIVSERYGREAISEYTTVEEFDNHTLLEFHPHTGRTHQIRLHCLFLNCPIAGAEFYGKKKSTIGISRHFLHAHQLSICLPNETEPMKFEAPLPEELENVLKILRE
jgi:23S rRNA-/tRNA-specific pseudouridylate synthase